MIRAHGSGGFIDAYIQITVVVDISDQYAADFLCLRIGARHQQLPEQMIF